MRKTTKKVEESKDLDGFDKLEKEDQDKLRDMIDGKGLLLLSWMRKSSVFCLNIHKTATSDDDENSDEETATKKAKVRDNGITLCKK